MEGDGATSFHYWSVFLFLISVYWSGLWRQVSSIVPMGRWWKHGCHAERERERESERNRKAHCFMLAKQGFGGCLGGRATVNTTTLADWTLKAFLWPPQNSWSNLACKDHEGPRAFIILKNVRNADDTWRCSLLEGWAEGITSNFILYYLLVGKRKFITINANIHLTSCFSPIILINVPTLWPSRKLDL